MRFFNKKSLQPEFASLFLQQAHLGKGSARPGPPVLLPGPSLEALSTPPSQRLLAAGGLAAGGLSGSVGWVGWVGLVLVSWGAWPLVP